MPALNLTLCAPRRPLLLLALFAAVTVAPCANVWAQQGPGASRDAPAPSAAAPTESSPKAASSSSKLKLPPLVLPPTAAAGAAGGGEPGASSSRDKAVPVCSLTAASNSLESSATGGEVSVSFKPLAHAESCLMAASADVPWVSADLNRATGRVVLTFEENTEPAVRRGQVHVAAKQGGFVIRVAQKAAVAPAGPVAAPLNPSAPAAGQPQQEAAK